MSSHHGLWGLWTMNNEQPNSEKDLLNYQEFLVHVYQFCVNFNEFCDFSSHEPSRDI